MIRVCVYVYDMGVFHRRWIQSVTEKEFRELSENEYHKVIVLDEGDWYGENAPSVLR